MLWPYVVSHINSLPQVSLPDHANKDSNVIDDSSHTEPIIQISPNKYNLPTVAITKRSLYLFNYRTYSPIAAHVRKLSSLEEYGENKNVKITSDGFMFVVETSKNYLMVFTIHNLKNGEVTTLNEVQTVFSSNGTLLQQGFPLIETESSSITSFISTMFSRADLEYPNFDFGLRFKLVLKVQRPLVAFHSHSSDVLMLLSTDPLSFQVINLFSKNRTDGKHIEVLLLEQLDWYRIDQSEVKSWIYSKRWSCFFWLTEKGNIWKVRTEIGPSNGTTKLDGVCLYNQELEDQNDPKIVGLYLNDLQDCLYLVDENENIRIYHRTNEKLHLWRIVEKPLSLERLIDIQFSPSGQSFITRFFNGWNMYSSMGNLCFSSIDHSDSSIAEVDNWLQFVSDIRFTPSNDLIISKGSLFFVVGLINLNSSLNQCSNNCKRPILYTSEELFLFKGWDKNLTDYFKQDPALSRDATLWLPINIPTKFILKNLHITSISSDESGTLICVVGNKSALVYHVVTDKWKLFDLNSEVTLHQAESTSNEQNNNIIATGWWKNHLFMALRNIFDDNGKLISASKVLVFSTLRFDSNDEKETYFGAEEIIWSFDFEETSVDEFLLYFNCDVLRSQLIVVSSEFNVYTWSMSMESHEEKKTKGRLILQRGNVYRLKNLFAENDKLNSKRLKTLKYVSLIDEHNIVMLFEGIFYCVQRSLNKDPENPSLVKVGYTKEVISTGIEFIQVVSADVVIAFNGCKCLYFDLCQEKNISEVSPIFIDTGSESALASHRNLSKHQQDILNNKALTIRKTEGTQAYPILIMSEKSLLFGLDIEISTRTVAFEDTEKTSFILNFQTKKRNYLTDLIDHQLKDGGDFQLAEALHKFEKFKQFQNSLELLLLNHVMNSTGERSDKDVYFDRLHHLIQSTENSLGIYSNFLRKVEVRHWKLIFDKLDSDPRTILKHLLETENSHLLALNYFIIMLNYENEDEDAKSTISTQDRQMATKIMVNLINDKDYERSFELFRFIKLIDEVSAVEITKEIQQEIITPIDK
ncbi:hypothetical protein PP7435_CHR4-0440 [Komagataella phaffii CBS 7435]|uniref:RIC1 C-terminal alpha solenoid region domain-containing protein n=2 Tax=Komagataella phaffii TaxID=460519 RepID=C4R869_KOMPG|nr:Hypothetical protein PAS_chr4_0534 [Komagataella phaffii GS115]AOA65171.1 GQ67_04904T0 [Komagataella phaffii]CAH2450813.1 hypothetical protein BQ9382_C4-2290 [Komagataella phaffii CBS 7435]AOA69679.1 GQ68_04876T0 [Komagataella phaffii GS115]CAY71794.1 Hypothetical protein PAS_chr4_0534 [Komagataella phaffii GS115]CCA40607.1 hypothetical protein PP7435_CHR4-0440 [Komagataella phaffii CBS 7435]